MQKSALSSIKCDFMQVTALVAIKNHFKVNDIFFKNNAQVAMEIKINDKGH